MSLSRYIGQKNVLGHALTATEVKTLHMVEPGVMHYKLRSKGGKFVTRTFKPAATPVMVAELQKKVRKVRKNKDVKRGPRAKLSPIGLAGMKILLPRGRPRKVRRHIVTPGSAIGLAGMKIIPARKRRSDAGKRRKASPGSLLGLAGMKIMMPRGRKRKVVRHIVTPGSAIGLAGMKIIPARKKRSNAGKKRGPRKAKSPFAKLMASLN
jgi:uncharacterized membrane protein YebE (DUF533 family)